MTIWAVIPVKFFQNGKSRLSSILNDSQRVGLIYDLLDRTIRELKKNPVITRIVIVTSDKKAKRIARDLDVGLINESGIFGLNWVVRKALHKAEKHAVEKVFILPIDLAYITAQDLIRFLHEANQVDAIWMSPDRKLEGTNAVLINAHERIRFRFGLNSFQKHLHEASRRNIPVKVFYNKNITFDLDHPEDYDYFMKTSNQPG